MNPHHISPDTVGFIEHLGSKFNFSVAEELKSFEEASSSSYPMIFDRYVREAALVTGLSVADILGRSRLRPLVIVRQILMYALYRNCAVGLATIGKSFNRDHTTVIHARDNVSDFLLIKDPEFMSYYNLLKHLCE